MGLRTIAVASFCLLACPLAAIADRIAVIGTGEVGAALGPEFAALGHEIVYGSRNPSREDVQALVARTANGATATTPADSVVGADIVVLAVPGRMAASIAADLGDLSGKIIIDPTNHFVRGDIVQMATDTSNAELIQAAAPDAYVVKAFNTLGWRQMVDPASSGGPISIPLASDNEVAKSTVAELVDGLDLEPMDVGPLQNARHVEGMLILWFYGIQNETRFEYHLRRSETP